ncbi:MAG: YbaN family protein, partial [Candidatus Kapaibacteriota bacterium]
MENKFNASSRTKRFVFIALGFFSLFLGIIGIFLPVLPTTPFILLSASLFAKSSRKLYSWLLSTRTFGKIIRDYNEKKGVKLSIKIFALSFLWLSILLSAIFFVDPIYLDVLLFLIASVVTFHILKLKTL